ncbi:MAG TPA: hypothetical protein VEI53_05390 [Ktedonobacteraceae bacterium]|nr:hypothetical protein [Ktedonobacteraceae bacterium]
MDPAALANAVMGILTQMMPFLGTMGAAIVTGIATDTGETIYQKGKEQGKRLLDAIHHRFATENDGGNATQALQNFVSGDLDYQSVVQTKLERLLRNDPGFSDSLLEIIRSGPLQSLIVGEEATAREIDMSNTLGVGTQKIETGKKSQVEGVSLNIAPPENN